MKLLRTIGIIGLILLYSFGVYVCAVVLMILTDAFGLIHFGTMIVVPSWYAPLYFILLCGFIVGIYRALRHAVASHRRKG